jgi:hypothetical protein
MGYNLWYRVYHYHFCLTNTFSSTCVGEIIHLNILGRSIVILSSAKAVKELLGKRGAIYSERLHVVREHPSQLIHSLLTVDKQGLC